MRTNGIRLMASNAATARITSPCRTSTISLLTPALACIDGAPALKHAEQQRGEDHADRMIASNQANGDGGEPETGR